MYAVYCAVLPSSLMVILTKSIVKVVYLPDGWARKIQNKIWIQIQIWNTTIIKVVYLPDGWGQRSTNAMDPRFCFIVIIIVVILIVLKYNHHCVRLLLSRLRHPPTGNYWEGLRQDSAKQQQTQLTTQQQQHQSIQTITQPWKITKENQLVKQHCQ